MKNRFLIPIMIVITILLLIKIYVANELYYTSRKIQKISTQINALKEERNILKLKIEKLKYKNTIIDPLFNYAPKINDTTINQDADNRVEPKSTKELFNTIDAN